jgi:ATP/maltotriose-dependent transcriptional regulator MalT
VGALTPRGELRTLWKWAEAFPEETLEKYPRLLLYVARLCQLIGESERGRRYLQQAERTLSGLDEHDPTVRGNQAILASYRAISEAYRGDPHEALRLARWADNNAPLDDRLFHARQANTFGLIHWALGDVNAAREAYSCAMELARQQNHHYLLLDSAFFLSIVNVGAGALHAIEALCMSLLDEYGEDIGPVCSVMVPLAYVYVEWNRLEEAQRLCERSLALARQERLSEVEWAACIVLALTHAARGNRKLVAPMFAQAEQAANAVGSRVVLSISRSFQARFQLASGDLAGATAWEKDYVATRQPDLSNDTEDIVLAAVLAHTGQVEQAVMDENTHLL